MQAAGSSRGARLGVMALTSWQPNPLCSSSASTGFFVVVSYKGCKIYRVAIWPYGSLIR
jgi:hypothetical protein